MFEIGTTLREARVRRKLTLQQVEEDTKIRVKYLQAMENEDFDVMPGATYVRGFLRTYATYLGMDPRIVLDEYNSRRVSGVEHEPFGGTSALRPRTHRGRNTLVFVAVLCLLILGVLYALGLGRDQTDAEPPSRPEALGIESASPSPSPKASAKPSPTQAAVPVNLLRLTTTKGDCWLQVRRDGPSGKLLFEGTVKLGTTRVWRGDVLWLRIGSPSAVGIRVGTEKMPAITEPGPVDVIVRDGALTIQR